jgi:hypothetical protein
MDDSCVLSPVYTQDIQRGVASDYFLFFTGTLLIWNYRSAAALPLMECSAFSSDDLLSTESQVLEELVSSSSLEAQVPVIIVENALSCRSFDFHGLVILCRQKVMMSPEQLYKTLASQDGVRHGITPEIRR